MGNDIKRALASVRVVDEVNVHPNADRLELLKVGGWQVVSGKGNFKAGDHCVFFEIDSFVPVTGIFDFLAKDSIKYDGKVGARIKTIRLRKELSQGLALPLKELFSEDEQGLPVVGEDVTDRLGIVKWEKYTEEERAKLGGNVKGSFPSWITKTDQERIQNLWSQFGLSYDTYEIVYTNDETGEKYPVTKGYKYHKDSLYEVSQKLDGSSMTVYYRDGEFGVCSRNLELGESEGNAFWQVARRLKLKERLTTLGQNIALQGELIGPGIQGNPSNWPILELFVFDIWDIDQQRYVGPVTRRDIVYQLSNSEVGTEPNPIREVPIYGNTLLVGFTSLDFLIAHADGLGLNEKPREGLVFKALAGEFSFKVISNKYLEAEK